VTNIIFVCLGNICRSPMAEFILKDMAEKAGLSDRFHIESAAVSTEEYGNPVYPPARRKLAEHGIGCTGKTARQLRREDYERFDLIIGMDAGNLRGIRRICGGDPADKVRLLLDYAGRPGQEVADPWYTGDFEAAWRDIEAGCRGLLEEIAHG
jgi:protein-tyrosine phosphatase